MPEWVCLKCGKRINEKYAYIVWGSDYVKGHMCIKCKEKERSKQLV